MRCECSLISWHEDRERDVSEWPSATKAGQPVPLPVDDRGDGDDQDDPEHVTPPTELHHDDRVCRVRRGAAGSGSRIGECIRADEALPGTYGEVLTAGRRGCADSGGGSAAPRRLVLVGDQFARHLVWLGHVGQILLDPFLRDRVRRLRLGS